MTAATSITAARPAKASPQRRERVLDAAESLFSKRGFYGVTVRQVAELAEVDVALPNYYFGSKRGLFDAVFFRRADILNRARTEGIERVRAAAAPGAPDLADILEAFIAPVRDAQASSDPGWRDYCRLVAQVNSSPEFAEMMSTHFDDMIARLISALKLCLPDLADRELYWAYHFMTGALTLTMANTGRINRLSHGLVHSEDARDAYAHFVTFFARGFTAAARD